MLVGGEVPAMPQAHRFFRAAAIQLGPIAWWMAAVGIGLLVIRYGTGLLLP